MSDDTAPKLRVLKSQLDAFNAIIAERGEQDLRWGLPNHDPFTWQTILAEEVGEYAKAALQLRYDDLTPEKLVELKQRLRKEAVQIAAVGVAMIECLDRGLWNWPSPTEIVLD